DNTNVHSRVCELYWSLEKSGLRAFTAAYAWSSAPPPETPLTGIIAPPAPGGGTATGAPPPDGIGTGPPVGCGIGMVPPGVGVSLPMRRLLPPVSGWKPPPAASAALLV